MNRKQKRSLADFDEPEIIKNKLPLAEIGFSALNPRTYFDPDKIAELAASFVEHDMLSSITVRPVSNGEKPYELVVGERRFRAAQVAELDEIEVKIRELSDRQALAIALEENSNREDLNPVEETIGILNLLSLDLGLNKDEITSLLYKMVKGRNVPTDFQEQVEQTFSSLKNLSLSTFVKDRLRLLNLPPSILAAIEQGRLQYTKGLLIARVKDETLQSQLLSEAIEEQLSIAAIKQKIAALESTESSNSYSDLPTDELVQNVRQTYSKLARSKKLWDNPKNRSKIEFLLKTMNNLLESS